MAERWANFVFDVFTPPPLVSRASLTGSDCVGIVYENMNAARKCLASLNTEAASVVEIKTAGQLLVERLTFGLKSFDNSFAVRLQQQPAEETTEAAVADRCFENYGVPRDY